jgi:His/Glu/Gln/Arg/opine family amino acid ABC transporter permease subunit
MDRLFTHFLNLEVLATYGPGILGGMWVTVEVAVLTVLVGVGLGFVLGCLRCLRWRVLDLLIVAWTDLFRTLPQLVVIVFVYFGLPYAGIAVSPFAATMLALAFVLSAFAGEIIWSAIQAVPEGQWLAARSLGLREPRILRLVVLPQAIRLSVPLLTNRAVAVAKGTALGAAVSLPELLGDAQSATSIAANPTPLLLAGLLYLALFLPLVRASRWLEQRFAPAA